MSKTVFTDEVIEVWLQLLHDFEQLPPVVLNRTFMQIGGYPHYENVCSNILAFFFDPENEHGLLDLCYKSLLQCVCEKDARLVGDAVQETSHLNIKREVDCGGKRLDLLLESDQFVIGIENKIWHHLNNDLNAYAKEVDGRAKEKDLKTIYIVLSIRNETPGVNFICITYSEFFQHLKSLLGYYAANANAKYVIYLNDFIKTIEDLQGNSMTTDSQITFFKDNFKAIKNLNEQLSNYQKELNGYISLLTHSIQAKIEYDNRISTWASDKSTLAVDFQFDVEKVSIETTLSPEGWVMMLFSRDKKQDDNSICAGFVESLKKESSKKVGTAWILCKNDVSFGHEDIKEILGGFIGRITAYMDQRFEKS